MPIRFSFKSALDALGQITAGTLTGKMIGQQQALERQQQEQQMRAQSLQPLLQHMNLLAPQAQAQVLGGYSPYVQSGQAGPPRNLGPFQGPAEQAPTPAMPQAAPAVPPRLELTSPAMVSNLGMTPTNLLPPGEAPPTIVQGKRPTPAPAPIPAAPTTAAPTIQSPFGPLSMEGVDEKAVKDYRSRVQKFAEHLAKADPNSPAIASLKGMMEGVPLNPANKEQLDQGNELLNRLWLAAGSAGINYREPGSEEAAKREAGRVIKDRLRDLGTRSGRELITEAPDLLEAIHNLKAKGGITPAWFDAYEDDIKKMSAAADAGDMKSAEAYGNVLHKALTGVDRLKPSERNSAMKNALATLAKRSPADLSDPKTISQVFADAGLQSIASEPPEELMKYARGAAYDAYQKQLRDFTTKFKDMTAQARAKYIDMLSGLAKVAGQKFSLKSSDFAALNQKELDEAAKLHYEVTGKRFAAKAAEAKAPYVGPQAKATLEYTQRKGLGQNKAAEKLLKQIDDDYKTALQNYDKYRTLNKNFIPLYTDPSQPPKNRWEAQAHQLYLEVQKAATNRQKAYSDYRAGRLSPLTKETSEQKANTPQGITRERRAAIIQGLKARGRTDAQINAALRRAGLM